MAENSETHDLIGSDKVEGTDVYGAGDDKIGSIERVMINKRSGKISYAVLAFGGFLGMGHDHYPVPWVSTAQIKKIAPQGVDLAVEATGVPSVMADAVSVTRQQGGRAVVIGNARHDAVFTVSPSVFNQGKSLLGTWGGDSVPDRDYPRYGRLLTNDRFPVRQLLSAPYSLTDINLALDDLRTGKISRPLIDMSKS